MNPEEFRRAGHQLIDWIADFRGSIEERPVASLVEPGEIRKQFPTSPPERGPSDDGAEIGRILRDLEEMVLPGISHFQHPQFYGFFPANATLSSLIGDYLSGGLGALGLAWQAAPALTEVEEVMSDWMRQMVGLSDGWRGVIQDTASTSTLVALICARERSTNFGMGSVGLQGAPAPLTVYVSEYSHSSVEKAALLAGFGRENVRAVAVDSTFALDPEALERAMAEDRQAGKIPCAIVATTGTTTSTALDPIAPLVSLADPYGAWVHVDAALAGAAMILPECRWMWDGIEGADSLVLNPHKWLGAAFDCSLYYVRDVEHLVRVMGTNPSYLQSNADSDVTSYRDWGIPLGRRFRALKLWTLIRLEGVEGLQTRLRRDMENARWLAARVEERPHWRVIAPVPLQTVCIRHEPPGLQPDALDAHNRSLAERVNRSGQAYLTPAVVDGRWIVRVSIGSYQTERNHVAATWDLIRQTAESSVPSQKSAEKGVDR